MSQIEKLLIPLLYKNIVLKDVDTCDFLGVYTEDINSPGVDYIYLVFKYDIFNLRQNLSNSGVDYVRRIENDLYHIYKFPRLPDIKKVLSGNYTNLSNEGISRIYTFWKDVDDITANYPFHRTIANEKYHRIIPEEKYVPFYKKREPKGLVINNKS